MSPQPQDKYVLRLPVGLRARIEKSAVSNHRSMNAEFVARLLASFGEVAEPELDQQSKESEMAGIGRRNQDQYMLRMPNGMRDQIANRASSNGRSMNTEIVMMLSAALLGPAHDDQRIARIEAKLDKLLNGRSHE